ncbi:MAG: DUF5132 domain-containing protein [Elainellaceae cyanobacterium]
MATETDFDFGDINLSEVLEGLGSVLAAPIVLPAAAVVNQPMVKSAIKEAMAFSERCKEAVAEASERIEDVVVEAQYELEHQQATGESRQSAQSTTALPPSQPRPIRRAHFAEGRSRTAGEMMSTFDEVNAQVGWLTNGSVDLRTLLPLGIGAFAVRQLFVQGLRLDDIPWYTMVWYAFDTFGKLNNDRAPQSSGSSTANGNGNYGFTPSGADTGIPVNEA